MKKSRARASVRIQGTLGSTESHPADTTNRIRDNPSSTADTNLSSYGTGNTSEIRETTTRVISLTPPSPPPPPPPPLPSTLVRGPLADPTHGTSIRVDELSENKAQSYPPSDPSRLPPIVPVRRPTQSQSNIRAQSTTIYPFVLQTGFPVSRTNPANSVERQESQQLPLQYSQELYRVPTTQTPPMYSSRAHGDVPVYPPGAPQMPYQSSNSNPTQAQQNVTPLRQNAPNTPFTYPGTPSQPYKSQTAIGPQAYSLSPTQPFVSQSVPPQSSGLTFVQEGTFNTSHVSHAPDSEHVHWNPSPQPSPSGPHVPPELKARSPQVQSANEGTSQQFVPQSAPPRSLRPAAATILNTGRRFDQYTPGFNNVPPRHSSLSGYNPITRAVQSKTSGRKVDAFVANDPFRFGVSHGDDKVDAPSDGPTFDDIPMAVSGPNFPQTMGPALYDNGSKGRIFPPDVGLLDSSKLLPHSNVLTSQMVPRLFWTPEARIQSQVRPELDDASEQADGLAEAHSPHTRPGPPTPDDSPLAPVPCEPPVPLAQQSPIIGPKSDDTTPFSTVLGRYAMLSNPHELQMATVESSLRPYGPHPPLPSQPIAIHYSGYPGYPQHHGQYPELSKNSFFSRSLKFVLITLPAQIYVNLLLLRLPSLYFSRVARIFEEADMTLLPEIRRMALETALQGLKHEFEIQMAFESSSVPPAYKRLKSTWEFFIDSVMREWKTFNIISVLLLTAILTVLQIQDAAQDPLTRYTALSSLMCTLMSLLFGCMYIICFGTMQKTYKAAEWATEAQKTNTVIWWNVWVLLAMPAIWLTWSIILYIACIMSFVWRSTVTSTTTPPKISDAGLLVIRIVITVVLVTGLLYGFLIMTTFRRYGVVMDKAWKQRIDKWIEEKSKGSFNPQYPPNAHPNGSTMYQQPTYNSSRYYQPSFGDAGVGGDARSTYSPAHASDAYVPPPDPYSPPTRLPHSQLPTDTVILNQSSNFKNDGNNMASAVYNPSLGTTPPPLPPKVPITSAEETPSMLIPKRPLPPLPPLPSRLPILGTLTTPFPDQLSKDKDNELGLSSSDNELMMVPKKPHLAVPPPPSPPPIPGTPTTPQSSTDKHNVLESSSGCENKADGNHDVPDNWDRVCF